MNQPFAVEFIQWIAGEEQHIILNCTLLPEKGSLVVIQNHVHSMRGVVEQVMHYFDGSGWTRPTVRLASRSDVP